MLLRDRVAARAEEIVASLTQTDYPHQDNIEPAEGIFDCDCNGFVGFVLSHVAPALYIEITPEPGQPRPRAFVYYDFFAGLSPETSEGWRRINLLSDARRGDVIAWRFPTIEVGEDTGHVLIVAEPAVIDPSGVYEVRVYDSAAKPHFFDTRGDGEDQFPSGVGSGIIKFKVDDAGRPVAFLFSPPASAEYSYLPIAIGRL